MPTHITPTIGCVVLFKPGTDVGYGHCEQPFAATVAYVNEDGTLNLSAVDHAGNQFAQQNVPLLQDGDLFPTDGSGYAYWMPYQIATAAKSEPVAPASAKS